LQDADASDLMQVKSSPRFLARSAGSITTRGRGTFALVFPDDTGTSSQLPQRPTAASAARGHTAPPGLAGRGDSGDQKNDSKGRWHPTPEGSSRVGPRGTNGKLAATRWTMSRHEFHQATLGSLSSADRSGRGESPENVGRGVAVLPVASGHV